MVDLELSVPWLCSRATAWTALAAAQAVHVVQSKGTFGSSPRALAAGLCAASALFAQRDWMTSLYRAVLPGALLPLQQLSDCLAEAFFLVRLGPGVNGSTTQPSYGLMACRACSWSLQRATGAVRWDSVLGHHSHCRA